MERDSLLGKLTLTNGNRHHKNPLCLHQIGCLINLGFFELEGTYNITENGLITNDLSHSPGWGTGLRVYRATVRNQDQRTIGKFIGQGRYCRTEKPRGKAL